MEKVGSLSPEGKGTSLLFVVAWNRPDLWDYFRRRFSGIAHVQVILDRRRVERRKTAEAREAERRGAERRRRAGLEDELRSSGFAITRLEDQ